MSQVYEIGGLFLQRGDDGRIQVFDDSWFGSYEIGSGGWYRVDGAYVGAIPLDLNDHQVVLEAFQAAASEIARPRIDAEDMEMRGAVIKSNVERQLDAAKEPERRRAPGRARGSAINSERADVAKAMVKQLWPKALADAGRRKENGLVLLKQRLDSWSIEDPVNRRTYSISYLRALV